MRKLFYFLALHILLTNPIFSQLDNSAFFRKKAIDSTQKGTLDLNIHNFNFLKNNEYFSRISDGITYFGYHIRPTISYQPGNNFKLEGGAFFWQDFGNENFTRLTPIFTLSYQKNNHRIHFGNIQAHLQHLYIEPLMNFERAIYSPLENGIQYIFENEISYLDVWINWKKAVYRGQQEQEEIRGGFTLGIDLIKNRRNTFRGNVQLLLAHQGGQISPTPLPISNLLNYTAGIQYTRRIDRNYLEKLILDFYAVQSLDFSPQSAWPFDKGQGFYTNISLVSKYLTFMVSYWNADQFINIQGGELYSSLSSSIRHIGYTETNRELLIFRFMKDFKISDELTFSVRLEPYWDFRNQFFEHNIGIYIHYNDIFRLANL